MSMEFVEEQQQLHIILIRLLRLPELHCGGDGEIKQRGVQFSHLLTHNGHAGHRVLCD